MATRTLPPPRTFSLGLVAGYGREHEVIQPLDAQIYNYELRAHLLTSAVCRLYG